MRLELYWSLLCLARHCLLESVQESLDFIVIRLQWDLSLICTRKSLLSRELIRCTFAWLEAVKVAQCVISSNDFLWLVWNMLLRHFMQIWCNVNLLIYGDSLSETLVNKIYSCGSFLSTPILPWCNGECSKVEQMLQFCVFWRWQSFPWKFMQHSVWKHFSIFRYVFIFRLLSPTSAAAATSTLYTPWVTLIFGS